MNENRRQRILVVEDEVLVAMLLEDTLEGLGYTIVGPAHRFAEGLAAAEEADIDMAVLDLNLDGQRSLPIADKLVERGIPFIFATGYGEAGLEGLHPDAPVVHKPFSTGDISRALGRLQG